MKIYAPGISSVSEKPNLKNRKNMTHVTPSSKNVSFQGVPPTLISQAQKQVFDVLA